MRLLWTCHVEGGELNLDMSRLSGELETKGAPKTMTYPVNVQAAYDADNLYLRLSIPFIPSQIYKILPYIVTVLVLIFSSLRNNREKQPPAALGVPYFREER